MNPLEHFFIGWCIAGPVAGLERRERALITLAAVVPDLDGLGMLVEIPTRQTAHPLFWWTEYHHVLAHNLLAGLLTAAMALIWARHRRALSSFLALLSFHTHIAGDVIGARGPDGYQWPIPYLLPFSPTPELQWSGQWALNAWQNFVITGMAMVVTLVIALRRGRTPMEIVSPGADREVVATLRRRFGSPSARAEERRIEESPNG